MCSDRKLKLGRFDSLSVGRVDQKYARSPLADIFLEIAGINSLETTVALRTKEL